ncbi:MAG: methyltransferase domain-containing protein [Firmicutes bacterium]|nr:methyltransferase domain-containing protein [Bacillota bacterium]
MKNNNFNEVGKFYEDKIAEFWAITHGRHMHTGYWDDKNMDAPIAEGARRTTEIMIEKAPIKENENFFDFGCGFGLPAIELAKRKKCNVYGITASNFQKIEAEKTALQEDVANLTNFIVCDAKDTLFKDNFFDGGWFFESIFHMGHEEALREARRVLKPKGVILLADFIALPCLNEADRNILFDTFQIKTLKRLDEYPDLLNQMGFDLIELWDITNQTIKIRTQKYNELLFAFKDQFVKIGGIEAYEKMKNFWDSNNQIIERNIGYVIVTCRKK